MSLHQLATTINASEKQTQVTFEKIDFLLEANESELSITSVNAKGVETHHALPLSASMMKLAALISDLTRTEYPEHELATLANPVMVLRVLQEVASHGTTYTDDAFYDLITRLKKHVKPIVIVDGLYVTTIKFANEQVTLQIRREGMYCKTVHFGYASTLKNVVNWIIVEYEQLNDAVPPKEADLIESLNNI